MGKIECEVNLFTIKQSIYIPGGNVIRADLEELPKVLSNCCLNYKINDIHLYGNYEYLNGLRDKIYIEAINTYGLNDIDVKIN